MSDALRASGAAILLVAGCLALPAYATPAGDRLIDAAHRDDLAAAAVSLRDHAPVNAAAPDGATALAWAAANSDMAMADLLLKAGANPDLANDYGVTPLILAAQLKNESLVKRLLEAHAKPNQPLWTGETPLMFAARTGSVPAMTLLVQHGADVNLREARHGQTALMWAAAAGQADAVRFLAGNHADVMVATLVVHVMITSAGAPQGIKTPIAANKGGLTAIMFAAQSPDSNPETIDALAEAKSDVNQGAADGTTPLLFALYRHVRPQDHFPHDTETVGDLAMAKALLAHGANPNRADANGLTPLAAVVFVARGSELIGQNGSNDEFILHPHDTDAQAQMKLLLDHGADPNLRIAEYYPPEPAGADLRYPSRYMNASPFLLAAAFEKPALVEMMMGTGRVNINTARDGGNTPLMDAVQVNSPIAVEALINAGADVNAVNPVTGRTALHLAAIGPSGAGKIVHDLVDHGARLDAKDKAGKTPMDLVKEAGPRPRGSNRVPPPPPGTAQILARGRPVPPGTSGQTEMLALADPAKSDPATPSDAKPSKTVWPAHRARKNRRSALQTENSMTRKLSRREAGASLIAAVSSLATRSIAKTPANRAVRYDTANGEWRTYGGDLKSLRYSALDQVTAENFNRLEPVWSYSEPSDINLQATPLMVKGVLYHTAGVKRAVLALDARTGKTLWRFAFDEGVRGDRAARSGSGHGLSYWTDGTQERILYVTIGYQLIALDAKTGTPVADFGNEGVVDLKQDDDQDITLDGSGVGEEIGLHATPLVVGDVVVIGAAHSASASSKKHVKGYVRGFDIRTGKRLWIFHTVPKKGEAGYETWLNGSAEYAGNTGNWSQNSADPELGLVYLAIEQPTDDYYGGFRPGNSLFSDCIVALDARTGKRRWYYQTVHHDIWDRDVMCAPILCDITVDGRRIKALAQPSKQAFTYVLDRTNGKPVWPIPEMPVPAGDTPGEWYAPTQPIPSRPPAFDVQGVAIDDLIDFTPELRAEAVALVANYRIGPLFTAPCESKYPGPLATIVNPGNDGAAQWPGGALDPQTNILYVYSNMSYAPHGLLPGNPAQTDLQMVPGTASLSGAQPELLPPSEGGAPQRRRFPARLAVQGLPLLKPPYGRITAIDLNKGEIVWHTPHGETPDDVRNHPALKNLDIPRTGNQGKVGTLATRTLIIAGDGTATTGKDGKSGGHLRAYDKASGEQVGVIPLPGRATGSPMTYALDGRQYIAIAVSGPGAQLAVYALGDH